MGANYDLVVLGSGPGGQKAAIAAAMERARQQREAAQPKNTDAAALTAAQRHEIAEIDARRQPAPEATAPAADEK